jgi:hypothetical protein
MTQINTGVLSGADNNYSNLVPWRYRLDVCEILNQCGRPIDSECGCGGCGEDASICQCNRPRPVPLQVSSVRIDEQVDISLNDQILGLVNGTPSTRTIPKRNEKSVKQETTTTTDKEIDVNQRALILDNRLRTKFGDRLKQAGIVPGDLVQELIAIDGQNDVYARPFTIPEDLYILERLQGDTRIDRIVHALQELPRIREDYPGIFSGRAINRILLPNEVSNQIDVFGNIFGGASSALVQRRIDQLNGFDLTVNAYNYNARFEPGTEGRPLIKDSFLIDLGDGSQSIWANRVKQYATDTQGYCIWTNGMPSRTIYLVRRKQPYYFSYRLPKNNPNFPGDPTTLNPNQGFYVTTDPGGGNSTSAINTPGGGVTPQPYPGTAILYPGNTIYFCVNDAWPDVLFYQSLSGEFMGGRIIVVGKFSGD